MQRFLAPTPLGLLGLALALLGIGLQLGNVQSGALAFACYGLAFVFLAASVITLIRPQSTNQQAQDATLDVYLNQMQEWLDDQNRPLAEDSGRRQMARTRTLAALERLGPRQKRRVLQFLQEHNLIKEHQHVVFLSGADFSGADLARMNLINTDLISINLSGADMSRASFSTFVWSAEDMFKAREEGVYVELFARPTGISRLDNANLSDAVLHNTTLAGCTLISANFSGADLDGADLRGADLQFAHNLTQKQINQAYGGANQREPKQNTVLPDHLEAPPSWSKPIYKQRVDRVPRWRRVIQHVLQYLRLKSG